MASKSNTQHAMYTLIPLGVCLTVSITGYLINNSLRGKWPNTVFFLVRSFLYSDWIQENTEQKKNCIWTFFMQWLYSVIIFSQLLSLYQFIIASLCQSSWIHFWYYYRNFIFSFFCSFDRELLYHAIFIDWWRQYKMKIIEDWWRQFQLFCVSIISYIPVISLFL